MIDAREKGARTSREYKSVRSMPYGAIAVDVTDDDQWKVDGDARR
jgi:hypothetical protein